MEDIGELAAALPGYEVGGELGRGAFGVVLAGTHRQLGRRVAIKQLPHTFGDETEMRRRFSAEAKVLASLDHPHIVPIFDYVERGGLCVLVMELLPGGTVRQRKLPISAGCAVALATSSALDYAHQRGVLHRDIKPDNLMFTSGGLLKVTDFGIARVVGEAAITKVGNTVGTPMYMAPEQCLGQPLGPATDVYATGLMLYELLAGRHPFAGGEAVAIMYRQIHEMPPTLSELNSAVPQDVSRVVMRALAKDPANRYHSARAFGGALAEAAARAWGEGWMAGEAARIMSIGPVEAATGWPLTGPAPTGGVEGLATGAEGFEPDPADQVPVASAWPQPAAAPPLQPTVMRAPAEPLHPPPFHDPVVPPPFPDSSPPDMAFPRTQLWAPPESAEPLGDPWGSGYWAPTGPPPADRSEAAEWLTEAVPGPPPARPPDWPTEALPGPPPAGPAGLGGREGPANAPTEALPSAAPVGGVAPSSPVWSRDWPADPAPTAMLPPGGLPPVGLRSDADDDDDEVWYESPRRPAASRRWLIGVVLALCAIGVGAVVGLLLVQHRSRTGPSGGAASPAGPAQVAGTISQLIRQSSAARAQVVNTVASIQDCSANLQTAASDLRSAVAARQGVVNRLQGLSVSGLANGAAMRTAFTSSLTDSIAADHDYESWLAAITASGGCTGHAPTNADYAAAVRSSDAADTAKATFVNLWNPIATTYGLPKVTSTSI
ncbi:MAG TPA: serine/threonine-protein kinase [Acidimicrobiales bacterium]|jgi:serine/threonine-protein kinase|nr:serine/threonine-protein kinase [Acidimicrobiales bacterium]